MHFVEMVYFNVSHDSYVSLLAMNRIYVGFLSRRSSS